jgi:hypothetical protein
MREAQDNKCAICGSTDPARKDGDWDVDHDHATGKVRGLLCHHCNIVIGSAQDNIDTLKAAIVYLEQWQERLG